MSGREVRTRDLRVLDEVARSRRQKKAIDALEQDNAHDEPHADLVMSKRAPKFQDLDPSGSPVISKKKKSKPTDYWKKYKKPFVQFLEEDSMRKEGHLYATAAAPPPEIPKRHFCSVCGFLAPYTCMQCGVKYCCIRCHKTHQDTRCQKYTA